MQHDESISISSVCVITFFDAVILYGKRQNFLVKLLILLFYCVYSGYKRHV
jgi:hypothetical protein